MLGKLHVLTPAAFSKNERFRKLSRIPKMHFQTVWMQQDMRFVGLVCVQIV